MAPLSMTLRLATPADLGAVDDLFARSYPRLLAADYPPSVMVTAVPRLARANPRLLASGRYWVVQDDATGRILGAGGWSEGSPAPPPGAAADGDWDNPLDGRIHVRHLATDPGHTRRGIATAIMEQVFRAARERRVQWVEVMSTLTAAPFYASLGFALKGDTSLRIAPGIDFPVVWLALPLFLGR